MESSDYSHFPIHINADRAKYDMDNEEKCVYVVVSHDQNVGIVIRQQNLNYIRLDY